MDIITKYFPNLSEEQNRQFAALYDLYLDWNSKINVISRKDIDNVNLDFARFLCSADDAFLHRREHFREKG